VQVGLPSAPGPVPTVHRRLETMGDAAAIRLGPVDPDAGTVSAVAGRIIEALSHPVRLGDRECQIGVSIGIACLPEHGTDSDRRRRGARPDPPRAGMP
jgi:predicted signal transduction protein with EAL and GGDEF domain